MILAIESSCDESALALFDPAHGLRGEWVNTQMELHADYGGVVPDLAAREHLSNFPVLLGAAAKALAEHPPQAVAVTAGPGLAGCLALGISVAKAYGLKYGNPVVGVNHMRGHAWSPFIGLHAEDPANFGERFAAMLPHLGLIVSGGHTILFELTAAGPPPGPGQPPAVRLECLGQTVDDAAGEALDKGAKLLGLGYPGGPEIEKRAARGNPKAVRFPRAFRGDPELRFSFAGLKTSLRYRLEKMSDAEVEAAVDDLCASYQAAVVDALTAKLAQAMERHQPASLGLSGGVANNRALRAAVDRLARANGIPGVAASPAHTGDNAAMIAFAAWADPAALVPPGGDALTFHPSLPL